MTNLAEAHRISYSKTSFIGMDLGALQTAASNDRPTILMLKHHEDLDMTENCALRGSEWLIAQGISA